MKKNYVLIIFLSFIVFHLLTACSSKNRQPANENILQNNTATTDVQKTEETDKLNEKLKLYKAFLQNEIYSETRSDGSWYLRDFCNRVVPGKTEDGIRYALFDMTDDGLPELHVLTDISYSIHTVENNRLVTWYEGDRYNRPLNNRAILQKIVSTGTHYVYMVLNSKGEEILYIGFSEPPGSNGKYLFNTGEDNVELSKSEWEKLTKPFLSIGSDKIIWNDVNNLDF